MIHFFVLGLLLMAGLILIGRWFSEADPTKLIRILKYLLFGIIGAAVLFFIFTGKFAWAFFSIPALVPWFLRVRMAHQVFRNFTKEKYRENKNPDTRMPMSKARAFEVLGLEDDANEQQIKEAHRRLISGIHPDHGGSTFLAMQINQAKDVLIGK